MEKEQSNERWKNAYRKKNVFFFPGSEILLIYVTSEAN